MCGIKGRKFIVLFRCKLNQFGVKNVYTVINLSSFFYIYNAYLRNITVTYFSVFYLQDGGRKNGGHRYETKLRHCHTMCIFNKSALSFVRQLTTWHCTHALLRAVMRHGCC